MIGEMVSVEWDGVVAAKRSWIVGRDGVVVAERSWIVGRNGIVTVDTAEQNEIAE